MQHSHPVFIGHFAVGFALKRAAPRTSLGWLMAAPQFLDMLWPCFLLLGWERVRIDPGNTPMTPLAFDSYPFSHSLAMSCVWGALLGALYLAKAHRRTVAWLIAAAVVSHWVLDWVTHKPDLQLAPWSSIKVGLGLWYSIAGTVIVESAMFIAGVWIYIKTTRARDGVGRVGFWAFVVFLALGYIANIVGPPPGDTKSLAIFTLGLWLFPLWSWWFDVHRATVAT